MGDAKDLAAGRVVGLVNEGLEARGIAWDELCRATDMDGAVEFYPSSRISWCWLKG